MGDSAIPNLTADKLLPPGVHELTLDEIEQLFGRFQLSDRRPRLMRKLREFVAEVLKTDCAMRWQHFFRFRRDLGEDRPGDTMIQTDEQLAFVREQLGHLEAALQDLEEEVRPQSEKQFALMSEIYVEHIAKLRREIEEYRPSTGVKGGGARTAGREKPLPAAKRRPA